MERILLGITIAGLSGVDSSILYLSAGEADAQKVFGIYDSLGTAGLMTAAGIYSLFLYGNYRKAAFFTLVTLCFCRGNFSFSEGSQRRNAVTARFAGAGIWGDSEGYDA